jgi:DNA-directed RNA polymerase specialized sigma24 family protein
VAIRIYCKTASRRKPRGGTAAIEAKTAKPETPFPPPDPKAERERDEREDKELEHLRELYPNEYAERLKAAFDDLPPFMREAGMGENHAAMRALLELRDKHGVVK